MPIILQLVLIAIIGYLWGSIPSGYWMGKLLRGKDFDIRNYGSHKTGATNVRRTLGNGPAAVVFVVDLSKGLVPTLLGFLPVFNGAGWGPTVAALAALLGHCFPIFIGFKGGRGVLTGAGALLIMSPLTFLLGAITTFSTIFISGYVSLGSIVGALTSIICGIVFYLVGRTNPSFFARVDLPHMVFMIVAPVLVILFHYDNIGRLLSGTESNLRRKDKNVPDATPSPTTDTQA